MAHSPYASNRYRTMLNVPLISAKAIIQDKEIYKYFDKNIKIDFCVWEAKYIF